MPDYRPLRPAASSPAPPPHQSGQLQVTEDVSVRSMKLKILYSFDNENKTNCLARWPNSIDVRTANLDENTQIGIVELKTCIQAIVAASPELVAKLGQDYTVYAYDYSEYETPLVGQGMLSWVLASSSATPSAAAHQSRTIVTGRVCRNILGLFSSSSQETLEVKLRLVPVPTSLQSEYLESMRKYRDISQTMPQGFDMQAWTHFLQANPTFLQVASQSRSQSPAVGPQGNGFGIEHVQRLLSGDGAAPKIAEAPHPPPQHNSFPSPDAAAQLPRPSSAASSIQSAALPRKRGRPPGVKTTTRGRGRAKKTETRQASVNPVDPGYTSNDEKFEEGPGKKRAKVTQAEWSGKADFGKQPESLRVAASTAASVRIHQPTALRPNNSLANALEGPPREPTPIADSSNRMQRPQLPPPKSSLRRESFVSDAKSYNSPYAPLGGPINAGESAMTSPEASQAESSPVDIGSSPPVYRGASTAGSSPKLPSLPLHFDDSGFMSGPIDDLFEDDEMRPIDDDDLEVAAQYIKRNNLQAASETRGSPPRLPEPHPNSQQPSEEGPLEAKAADQKRQMAANAQLLTRTASSGNLAPPPAPASDPIRPTALHRSQTWSGNQAPHPMSDLPPISAAMETFDRPMARTRRESENCTAPVARRKQAIQSKLASSVAAGEMPPFCENCGAIETPTWRKAWIKIHSGSPEHVVISEEEGGVIAWQTLQTDLHGNVCLYRIIKKAVLKTDEGFTEVLLCNPCGLWLHTRKCMRPREVWEKPPNGGDGKRKRPASGKQQRTNSGSDAAANAPSAAAIYSDASSTANHGGQNDGMETEPRLPVTSHRRASSDQWKPQKCKSRAMNDASAMMALQRAIKSSPHRFSGTEHVPIEVEDLTPQPTRRILFHSPTQPQEARSKASSVTSIDNQKLRQKTLDHASMSIADQANKENCPPTEHDGLDQLFEEDPFQDARSKTPTPTSLKRATLFKTPLRSPERHGSVTGDFFSSAAKALLHPPMTPKRSPAKGTQPLGDLTPFTAHLNQLLSETNNASPGSQSFDFPSLPSLRNTPGRPTRNIDFDFSQFDSEDLLSTDVPMPSSPPVWFGVYEDPIEHGAASLWSEFPLPTSASTPPNEETVTQEHKVKPPGFVADEERRAGLDIETMA